MKEGPEQNYVHYLVWLLGQTSSDILPYAHPLCGKPLSLSKSLTPCLTNMAALTKATDMGIRSIHSSCYFNNIKKEAPIFEESTRHDWSVMSSVQSCSWLNF
eukprot:3134737-Amphidinium_carterae.2